MAWRQQQQKQSAKSDSNESDNKFDKFFKKKNTPPTRFVNQTYDRDFSSEPKTDNTSDSKDSPSEKSSSSYHEGFDPTKDNELRNNYRNDRRRSFYNDDRGRNNFRNDNQRNYNDDRGRNNFRDNYQRNYKVIM